MDDTIRKYALQNALKFKGKANPGAIVGKLIGEKPALQKEMGTLGKQIAQIVADVNSLSLEEQKLELENLAPDLLKKKVAKKKTLTKLKGAKNVVMRFEPSPSGPMHIGHAYVLGLNALYCRKYKGKLLLRIADTNPDNIYEPAYEMIPENANWLTDGMIKDVVIQSDRLEMYYSYMEKLLKLEQVYVCTCDPETFREGIRAKQRCPCRVLVDQKSRWDAMFTTYKMGEAVVRLKTDVEHKNPAMRDFPLFRINESKHPKQGTKYRVWPLMNMSVTVDDIESKVTHIIRAKDHHDNALRQKYIYEYLEKKFPETLFVGRINFTGMAVSCSKTRPLIEDGTYHGWDDIRLPFLPALKRRGFQAEALLRYAFEVGVSLSDKKVSKDEFFKTIDAYNKEVIDSIAYRYFFVQDPVEIRIAGVHKKDITLDLHPDTKKGGRTFSVGDTFHLAKEDYDSLSENAVYRLMDCLNVRQKDGQLIFDSDSYDEYKASGKQIIHWLPKKGNIAVEVMMPDGTCVSGLGEQHLSSLKEGDVVQLVRFGFCRLDKKSKSKLVFWFAHR
ncbi:MAG: glutamate--tRNA ligase [Nanoarchaeota archaeon]|nr:glutamate--tRNA ligase [Nanoarchaeota archaeon]